MLYGEGVMSLARKTSNFMMIAILMLSTACGQQPWAQPHTVADDGYLLSFTRVNLVEPEAQYHFQLCRQQEEGEQACFNPYETSEGEPLLFTALPEQGNLQTKGTAGRLLHYAAGAAVVLLVGTLAFVLTPKAAHLALTKMFDLHKASKSGKADDVIKLAADKAAEKAAKKSAKRAKAKAAKLGEDFNYDEHYKRVYNKHYQQSLKQKNKDFSIFKTKPALFITSLFIVEGTIRGWEYSYDSWRDANAQLKKWSWGEGELELAAAYPFLVSSEAEAYRVTDIKRVLETLRDHHQLVFSADYLREFPPPVEEKNTIMGLPPLW